MSTDNLVFNGIDGDTGRYDLPPMSAEELVQVIRGEVTPENLNELRFRVQQATTAHLGVKEGVDPKDVAAAGWGVIFPAYPASDPDKQRQVEAIREALQPLLKLRQKTAANDRLGRVGAGQRQGLSRRRRHEKRLSGATRRRPRSRRSRQGAVLPVDRGQPRRHPVSLPVAA